MPVACPFCSIPPGDVVLAMPLVVAIRHRFPVSPGHTLVLPRRHVETYFDASADEQAEIWAAVSTVKAQLDHELSPDGYNVGFNSGEAAGQTVMHLHVHVIPRTRGDTPDPRGGVRGVIAGKQKYGASPDTGSAVPTGNPFSELASFVPGEGEHLVEQLRAAMARADEIDILSAFVQPSGLDLVRGDLEDALHRGARVRLLTGDYLGVTSPDALRALLGLASQFPALTVRFHQCPDAASFHAKAYVFATRGHGIAYVGSSNLSRAALTSGVEWNLRAVTSAQADELRAIRARFERLFWSTWTAALTRSLVDEYALRVKIPPAPEPRAKPPSPHPIQREALDALLRVRAEGARRGLVVMATGLGKTLLAAFDFARTGGARALFVAHREEILTQARDAWASVFPDRVLGIVTGDEKEPDADLVFASVQTLARKRNLESFAPDRFDYVVIDEFHHAAATTYRKVLAHFSPRFMLGLTATPDRMDGASLYDLCDDNLVYRVGIVRGIASGWLVPFEYFGVKDAVDFEPIPWRSGKFAPEALTEALATRERAAQALREYRAHAPAGGRRTLAFCCSVAHADFMARYLSDQGVKAVAVHSEPTSAPRAETLRRFRAKENATDDEIEVICAVDVFNEGLDVPDVNVILMLRPTESPIIFLQQLGRGLRKPRDSTKGKLTIVDFIGNHRSFLSKPQALLALTGQDLPPGAALRALRDGKLDLPPGCKVDVSTDVIDMLERVSRMSKEDMLVYEYLSLRNSHGRRPTAGEVFAVGVDLKPLNARYRTWFDFVDRQGDLTDYERAVLERHADWFRDLMRTAMSASYKMVALRVLLDVGALRGRANSDGLAGRCRVLLENDLLLRSELAGRDAETFARDWRKMPLGVWAKGEGTTRKWFALEGDDFVSKLGVADEDADVFDEMTSELVDLRLREWKATLRRRAPVTELASPIRMRVSHASGRPILRFDRARRPDVPAPGDVRVVVDGEAYLLMFREIAVNKAVEVAGGPNVLPRLMRAWFGPNAGLPGTRHHVLLYRHEQAWHLRADAEADEHAGATVLAFPHVPFYRDLRVACGAAIHQHEDVDKREALAVRSEHAVDPKRHFVVQASGDSMDGGARPIRDGDLVLCEWLTAFHPEAVEGKACLVSGTKGAEITFAQIKVPVRKDGRWYLRSWSETFEDQPIEAGTKLEPVARVVGVVEEAGGPVLWGLYDREAAVALFGVKNDRSWQVGHRDVEVLGNAHSVLFVTLRKPADTPIEQRYADRFLSPSEFQWESQAKTTPEDKKGRSIVEQQRQGRRIHLFARYDADEKFVYCGTLTYVRHRGERPIRVWFRLDRELPEELWRLWAL